jgi:chemotaxis protein CheD
MREIYNQKFRKNTILIEPGEYCVTGDDVVLSTLLGSCVAACLFDPLNNVIGMNHFLLAGDQKDRENLYLSEAGRYGINAMELLITCMMKLGADRKFIKAKAFGGGHVLNRSSHLFSSVSEKNVIFVKDFLASERIELISADFGGYYGRKIFFYNHTFSVYVKNLDSMNSRQVEWEEIFFKKKREKIIAQEEKERIAKSTLFE